MKTLSAAEAHTAKPLVLVERRQRVGLITLNRPEARNALSPALMTQLADALAGLDAEPGIACIVIAGSDEAFAAGADVAWLASRSHEELVSFGAGEWPRIRTVATPLVAAVSGWALGGGCELALSCDMIVASETARFGQPEILLGFIPGAGGTQRLARAIGRQRSMELLLTGRRLTAEEARGLGLVNRVTAADRWLDDALQLAAEIADRPTIAARLVKQAVRAAENMPFDAAIAHERRLFELALACDDAREGMVAFLEKRTPRFPSVVGSTIGEPPTTSSVTGPDGF